MSPARPPRGSAPPGGEARSARGALVTVGSVEFVDAGVGVSIQDAGRSGHRAIGVPLAGAADPVLLACANALLAQAGDTAALEIALVGPTLRAHDAPLQLALAGDFAPCLTLADGTTTALASWRSVTLAPGEVFAAGPCRSGIGYLAIAGGCDVPRVLGSRSTYARAALGGIDGRAPRAGDRLPVRAAPGPERRAPRPFAHADGPLRVLGGPQDDHFDAAQFERFVSTDWRVSREADRMGLRLEGPALAHRPDRGADIVSEGVVPGAVQVPGAGLPIVLGVDAQTIGGYAKIATAIRADVPRLAHARPGAVLRFRAVTRGEALAARRDAAATFADWLRRIEPLHGRSGEAIDAALRASNLISGMIDAAPAAADTLPWE
ncbi:MAG: biotin-dependent carboxyltransferase family protein [Ideonella sp.]|nr:biotin-dependent carboxyltransferase family protein [Ideonella sp.]